MHPSAIVWKRLTNGPIAMHTYEARSETLVSLRLPRLRTQDSEPPPNKSRISRGCRVARGVPRERSERPLADHVTPKHVGCMRQLGGGVCSGNPDEIAPFR